MRMMPGVQQLQVQSAQLAMSPQMRQSLELLQCSSLELIDFIHEKLNENPLLEVTWQQSDQDSGDVDRYIVQRHSLRNERPEVERTLFEAADLWSASEQQTLEQHLNAQLRLLPLSAEQRKITHYIAGNLTEAGYFELPLVQVAAVLRSPLVLVEQSLTLVQSMDPAGVAAQNLGQCLFLQLERMSEPVSSSMLQPIPSLTLAKALVQQYLVKLAEGQFNWIAQQLSATVPEVEQAYAMIRNLQPKPGLAFGQIERQPLIPDADVRLTDGGKGIEIVPNEAMLPRIELNAEAKQWLKSDDRSVQQYVRGQQRVSDQLIRGLEQRKRTIQLVLERLVLVQQAFFLYGAGHMQPLTMRQLASDLGLHESTISRTIRHKVIRTPHGLMSLKQFFVSSLPGVGGTEVSSEKIKAIIAQWVSEEDRALPLSDQQISTRLAMEGMFVSRRTVMKYREAQRILSSRLRKQR